MKKYNFDEIIDRSGTTSLKWDAIPPLEPEQAWVPLLDWIG